MLDPFTPCVFIRLPRFTLAAFARPSRYALLRLLPRCGALLLLLRSLGAIPRRPIGHAAPPTPSPPSGCPRLHAWGPPPIEYRIARATLLPCLMPRRRRHAPLGCRHYVKRRMLCLPRCCRSRYRLQHVMRYTRCCCRVIFIHTLRCRYITPRRHMLLLCAVAAVGARLCAAVIVIWHSCRAMPCC